MCSPRNTHLILMKIKWHMTKPILHILYTDVEHISRSYSLICLIYELYDGPFPHMHDLQNLSHTRYASHQNCNFTDIFGHHSCIYIVTGFLLYDCPGTQLYTIKHREVKQNVMAHMNSILHFKVTMHHCGTISDEDNFISIISSQFWMMIIYMERSFKAPLPKPLVMTLCAHCLFVMWYAQYL